MSPAAVPLLRIPVGVVVERRKTDSPWIDFIWRGVGVLPDEPEMKPWTVLREQDEATLYYAGSATVDLYRSETQLYRDNMASGTPSIWIVLSPSEGSWPYAISAVTADPAEGEAYTEAAANLVETVAMPEMLLRVGLVASKRRGPATLLPNRLSRCRRTSRRHLPALPKSRRTRIQICQACRRSSRLTRRPTSRRFFAKAFRRS